MKRSTRIASYIKTLQKQYLTLLPEKESLLKIINETEVSEQVYNSNAIENSTLTLEETEKILLQIDLDRFINEREFFEAKNLARVVEYINNKASEKDFSFDMILLLHKMLISNIRDDIAGRFRNSDEWVKVGNYIAPNPNEVENLLKEMLLLYKTQNEGNIVKRIALLHLMFEHIHPFVDGNGRIGRVLINYALIREGFVPINIKFIDRKEYYNAFRAFDISGSTDIMEGLIEIALCQSFHKRLAYMEGKKIILLQKYAEKEGFSYPNCINKAKRQSIEAFWEKGKWKIGVKT